MEIEIMTYVITRAPKSGLWAIVRSVDGSTVDTIIGTYATRKQATVAAKLLAGWRGRVIVCH